MDLRRIPLPALALGLVALVALYAGALRTGFLNDDYLFLEEARTRPVSESLRDPGALGNYYRPLSRQLYFELLTPLAGGRPVVFHAVSFALFLLALALLGDLLVALAGPLGALAGTAYFALLPLQRVNLIWISCSQDLLALAGALGGLALFRRGRAGWATVAYLLALAGKESAAPLPLLLVAWGVWIERRAVRDALRRSAPLFAAGAAWAAIELAMRASHAVTAARLDGSTAGLLAAYAHAVQSLVGLETPGALPGALATHAPDLVALAAALGIAWWVRPAARPAGPGAPPVRRVAAFGAAWIAGFAFVTWPVAYTWSAYYYTLSAVGGAVLVALALRRMDRWAWAALAVGMLWLSAGAAAARSFAVVERPWVWTSHLTSFYFERAASLTSTLGRDLLRREPSPPESTRFFFATLPPFAGFQMGNGALIRDLYHDPSLASHFYSRFSDSTADHHPCRFLYWDGAALRPLYPDTPARWFQVGTDLLLLDHPRGASFAFRRGLGAGGERTDLLYWLGWAELYQGRRERADRAWIAFGARDDTLRWYAHLLNARRLLLERRDTVETKRNLIMAIRYGIGHPEAHEVLGQLLMTEHPKYGALELQVASRLKPDDWLAHRDLAAALAGARLDDGARREMRILAYLHPSWPEDSVARSVARELERRAAPTSGVVRF